MRCKLIIAYALYYRSVYRSGNRDVIERLQIRKSHTRGDIRMRIMMRWRNWTSSQVLHFLYCWCEILDFKRYYNNAYRLRNTINVFLKFIEVLFVTRSTKPRFSLWKFCNTLIVTPDEAATALHWIFLCIINWVGTTPTIVHRMLLYTSH